MVTILISAPAIRLSQRASFMETSALYLLTIPYFLTKGRIWKEGGAFLPLFGIFSYCRAGLFNPGFTPKTPESPCIKGFPLYQLLSMDLVEMRGIEPLTS